VLFFSEPVWLGNDLSPAQACCGARPEEFSSVVTGAGEAQALRTRLPGVP